MKTSDGYILTIHRIPYSHKNTSIYSRPVVFLQHGLLCSSSNWVLSGPENGLAFLLSDMGYDVWMGNVRGNSYSKAHVKLSVTSRDFWNFDWHHIALYDLPAMINKVLYISGQTQLDYIGHSQGTTIYFVLNSYSTSFRSIFKSGHLLAPVGYMSNMKSPLAQILGPVFGDPKNLVESFGSREFFPNTQMMEKIGVKICRYNVNAKKYCQDLLFIVGGFYEDNLNKSLVPDIMSTTPAGCSGNQLIHYLQEYESGYFREWDYGLMNKVHYNSSSPPNYLVKNIKVPTYFYYSDNDFLSNPKDVLKLVKEMPQEFVAKLYNVKDPKFTHLDFLWGLNAKEMVYDFILDHLKL